MLSKVLVGLTFAVVVTGACTCGGEGDVVEPDDYDSPEAVLQMDQEIDQMLQELPSSEARAWLARPNVSFWNEGSTDILAVVEGFYGAGASRVLVDGIETMGGREVSASIVVVLPSDPASRERVFAKARELSPELAEDTPPDHGQRYLSYAFD